MRKGMSIMIGVMNQQKDLRHFFSRFPSRTERY